MTSAQPSLRDASEAAVRIFATLQARYTVIGPVVNGFSPEIGTCVTRSISTTKVVFECSERPLIGAVIHLTIATLGAWPARVSEYLPGGFAAVLDAKSSDAVKLARRLDWLKRLQNHDTRNRRTHQRFVLPPLAVELRSQDGISVPATLLDLSCSGAGVRASSRLPLGTLVEVNGIPGQVARCFDGGMGVRFNHLQSLADLKQKLLAGAKR